MSEYHKSPKQVPKGERGCRPQPDLERKVSEEPGGNEEKHRAAKRLK